MNVPMNKIIWQKWKYVYWFEDTKSSECKVLGPRRAVSSRPPRITCKLLPPFPIFRVILERRYQTTKLYDVKIKIFIARALQISIFVRYTLFWDMRVKMIVLPRLSRSSVGEHENSWRHTSHNLNGLECDYSLDKMSCVRYLHCLVVYQTASCHWQSTEPWV